MSNPRILAFSGSARKGSYNQQLVSIAAKGAEDAGADVTLINLKDYPLPVFDQDLEKEQGTPENATKLKQLFFDHDGLLIASPEFNSSITPLLKNVIDWVSRKAEGEVPLGAYKNKVATLLATSPGGLGGIRGLVHVRAILSSIGVIVLPGQIAVPDAMNAFDADGNLQDDKKQSRLLALGKSLAEIVQKTQDSPS